MNLTVIGSTLIVALILIALGCLAYQHRPVKAPPPPTLAQELETSIQDALRQRIAYEGEAEFAEAMAAYQNKRWARLSTEREVLAHERSPVTVAEMPEGFLAGARQVINDTHIHGASLEALTDTTVLEIQRMSRRGTGTPS